MIRRALVEEGVGLQCSQAYSKELLKPGIEILDQMITLHFSDASLEALSQVVL